MVLEPRCSGPPVLVDQGVLDSFMVPHFDGASCAGVCNVSMLYGELHADSV